VSNATAVRGDARGRPQFPDGSARWDVPTPAELRELSGAGLERLASEIRAFLIRSVARAGGHLGPNLGVVELTIALHRVFDSPRDTIVFDTGHQAYVHKILTGRREGFTTLRQAGGLSGYPSRAESPHDTVENSHASTALSYADGLAKAYALRGQDRRVVAVVGDGALTGGMAWEAINNLGAAGDLPVVVVLNDNSRSYAPTVGGLAVHLATLRADGGRAAGTVFENLGLAYLGPVDGHDVAAVEQALRAARELRRPVVVHCVTVKGKGFCPAEQDAERMHAVGAIDEVTGEPTGPKAATWTDTFGEELCAIAAERDDVVAITAAMPGPTGLGPFLATYPRRFFDVGIAEQQAVTAAAGMAMGGLHPVVAVYSSFLNRAFDQVLMDVALHRLAVTFVLDRAGVTGPDAASHHGMWDTSILSVAPGLRIAAPRDPDQLRALLREAVVIDGPTVLRYPKATAGREVRAVDRIGGVDVLAAHGRDVLLVALGPMATPCVAAARLLAAAGVGVTVVDPRWALPVESTLVTLAGLFSSVVTAEDGCRVGGLGAAIAQACADAGVARPVHNLGLPAQFVAQGERTAILAESGLDAAGITRAVLEQLAVPAGRSGAM
jgi:1-deoxy-D-xylulose-5-phosphate synthase